MAKPSSSVGGWRDSAAGVVCALVAVPIASSADSLGQLSSELGQQQARQQRLQSSVSGLSRMIGSLSSQIALVQSRESEIQAELANDRVRLGATHAGLIRDRQLLALLRAHLARGRMLLARQLVSNYEFGSPDLMTVLLESNGFKDLLERITFLRHAQQQQQTIITFTRKTKAKATAAAQRLGALEATEQRITLDAESPVRRDRIS